MSQRRKTVSHHSTMYFDGSVHDIYIYRDFQYMFIFTVCNFLVAVAQCAHMKAKQPICPVKKWTNCFKQKNSSTTHWAETLNRSNTRWSDSLRLTLLWLFKQH